MNSLLFREAHEQRIKHLVFFSCSVFYGDRPEGVREDDFDANETMHPRYFGVGWTKIYLEKMAEFYSRLGNTRFSVVRHSNVYGPWDKFDLKRSHVFGATMAKVLTATDQVTVWGDGNESRDLLFVSDLIDFVERVLKKQESAFDLTHVGLGRAVTIRELVHKMIACSGKQLEVNYDPSKPTIPVRLFLDTTRAQTLYGWTPRVTLDDGIEKTMEWVRNHLVLT
jgi:nucleoside-diphosphate-sugar epimerase